MRATLLRKQGANISTTMDNPDIDQDSKMLSNLPDGSSIGNNQYIGNQSWSNLTAIAPNQTAMQGMVSKNGR